MRSWTTYRCIARFAVQCGVVSTYWSYLNHLVIAIELSVASYAAVTEWTTRVTEVGDLCVMTVSVSTGTYRCWMMERS